MACVLRPLIRATHPDKGEHRSSRICESVVCPPGGTRIKLVCHMSPLWGGQIEGTRIEVVCHMDVWGGSLQLEQYNCENI